MKLWLSRLIAGSLGSVPPSVTVASLCSRRAGGVVAGVVASVICAHCVRSCNCTGVCVAQVLSWLEVKFELLFQSALSVVSALLRLHITKLVSFTVRFRVGKMVLQDRMADYSNFGHTLKK